MSTYYDGEITAAHMETMDDDELVICFDVALETGENVMTRTRTMGNYPDIAKQVCEHLDIEWPFGLHKIDAAVGKAVRIKHKQNHKDGKVYDNYYIVTSRRAEPAEPDTIKRAIDKLAKKSTDDEVPF